MCSQFNNIFKYKSKYKIQKYKQMSSSRSIIEQLSKLTTSPEFSRTIPLNTKTKYYDEISFEYESIANQVQLLPPSAWFTITQALQSIKNDIQRSRTSREGLISTSSKGHLFKKVAYQMHEEDIGTIQQVQQSFCVSFAVVKDQCDDYFKHIRSELTACLTSIRTLIDQSHLKVSELDQISKQIYSRIRIFLIFDCKAQPGRILSIQSWYYPNVRFRIQRIKKISDKMSFASNQVLVQIQNGKMSNDYGFLTLDMKKRLFLIKKDDPELAKQAFLGVWVIGPFPSVRNKNQFSKEDAMWNAILQFYTNPEIVNKISILPNLRGYLAYFNVYKQGERMRIHNEFYLFNPQNNSPPKWTFQTKSQFVADLSKNFEVKLQVTNTIIQEREYSQISDQTNTIQEFVRNAPKMQKNEQQINQIYKIEKQKDTRSNDKYQKYEKSERSDKNEKDKLIDQLKSQVQKWKQKCMQLEAMNKILLQQKMMAQMMQRNYSMMNQMQPNMMPMGHMYPHMQMFPPNNTLAYSQVSSQGFYPHQVPVPNQTYPFPQKIQKQEIKNQSPPSPKNKVNQVKNRKEKDEQQQCTLQKSPAFKFNSQQENKKFSQGNEGDDNKLFIKKSQSYGPESTYENVKFQQDQNNVREFHIKKDARNISFQDSFADYHSDGQNEQPFFKANLNNESSKKKQANVLNILSEPKQQEKKKLIFQQSKQISTIQKQIVHQQKPKQPFRPIIQKQQKKIIDSSDEDSDDDPSTILRKQRAKQIMNKYSRK